MCQMLVWLLGRALRGVAWPAKLLLIIYICKSPGRRLPLICGELAAASLIGPIRLIGPIDLIAAAFRSPPKTSAPGSCIVLSGVFILSVIRCVRLCEAARYYLRASFTASLGTISSLKT